MRRGSCRGSLGRFSSFAFHSHGQVGRIGERWHTSNNNHGLEVLSLEPCYCFLELGVAPLVCQVACVDQDVTFGKFGGLVVCIGNAYYARFAALNRRRHAVRVSAPCDAIVEHLRSIRQVDIPRCCRESLPQLN